MANEKHSPLPWKITYKNEYGDYYIDCCSTEQGHIAIVDRLIVKADNIAKANAEFIVHCVNTHESQQAEIERLQELFHRLDNWRKAYPLDIFPKPDLKKAAEVLKDNGMTLDSISADNMRHVLDRIKGIIDQALKGDSNDL